MSDNELIESDDEIISDDSSDDLQGELEAAIREVNERARDEQGRFAKREEEIEPEVVEAEKVEKPIVETKATNESAQNTTEQPTQQTAVVRAPDAWSPAAKAQFDKLPQEVRDEIVRRETEIHKGFTRQDEQRNLGKSFEQAVTPYLAMIRAEGSDPLKAVDSLLQTAYKLRSGTPDTKEQLLIGLMQQYQIDPNRVFQRLSGGQQVQQSDPQVANLQQQIQQLQQRQEQEQLAIQQREQAQIDQAITSFASDPKNLYFANVKADMAALLSNGSAKDMQEAYDMACWARPDIRGLLLKEQQQKADTQARAVRAKAASSSITGSPSGAVKSGAKDEDLSLEDELRRAYRAAHNRD